MDLSPILISLKTASAATVVTFFLGVLAARWVFSLRVKSLKMALDALFTLPLVLPPTVAGFFLLYLFGIRGPIGAFLMEFLGVRLVFSWPATVLAAAVISFPLMYRSARGAFELVDVNLFYAARTLGLREGTIFWRILLPTAAPGVISGAILAFARGLGEFGATIMIAGNIAGETRTLPVAVYSSVMAGDWTTAGFYVAVIVGIALLVICGMQYFSSRGGKRV